MINLIEKTNKVPLSEISCNISPEVNDYFKSVFNQDFQFEKITTKIKEKVYIFDKDITTNINISSLTLPKPKSARGKVGLFKPFAPHLKVGETECFGPISSDGREVLIDSVDSRIILTNSSLDTDVDNNLCEWPLILGLLNRKLNLNSLNLTGPCAFGMSFHNMAGSSFYHLSSSDIPSLIPKVFNCKERELPWRIIIDFPLDSKKITPFDMGARSSCNVVIRSDLTCGFMFRFFRLGQVPSWKLTAEDAIQDYTRCVSEYNKIFDSVIGILRDIDDPKTSGRVFLKDII